MSLDKSHSQRALRNEDTMSLLQMFVIAQCYLLDVDIPAESVSYRCLGRYLFGPTSSDHEYRRLDQYRVYYAMTAREYRLFFVLVSV